MMEPFPCWRQWRCTDSTWMCTVELSGTCWVMASWLNRSNVIKKRKKKMNEPQNPSHFTKIRQLWNTCESLSLSQPEPMMKATSCPSSNQPRDSSGHWPRKLRTSSRVSGHSPDTDINAGEDFRECVSLWEEWKWKHEKNMLSLTL